MADLRRERGQIVLVAAFLLAVTFVLLAVVVNSAIFAQNTATQQDVAGAQEALDQRADVETSVQAVIHAENTNLSLDVDDVDAAIETVDGELATQQATLGRVVSLDLEETKTDTWVAQDSDDRQLTNATGGSTWSLDIGAEEIRGFRMNVTDSGQEGKFNLTVDDGDEWSLTINASAAPEEAITVSADGETHDCEGADFGSYVAFNVTGETLGEHCPDLDEDLLFGETITAFDDVTIEFEHGETLEGSYEFLLVDPAGEPGGDSLGTDPDAEPFSVETVRRATLSYEFYTPAVGYETEIAVESEVLP